MGRTVPIRIVNGLDIPVAGAPEQAVGDGPPVTSVALLGTDYRGLRPALRVVEGQQVRLGQVLFADRRRPRIQFTAPAAGTVVAIHRGARRALLSVVLRCDGADAADEPAESFPAWPAERLSELRRDQVVDALLNSGMWTALRARPFGGVADPDTAPAAIFVTAIDTDPLAADAAAIIALAPDDFAAGIRVVARLGEGPVHVCGAAGADLPDVAAPGISVQRFSGPHPSGLVGTHIHMLHPPPPGRVVWHLDYQDAIAIGRLFTTGRLAPERIVALGGPLVRRPRLLRTRMGASTDDLVARELADGPARIVSGSLLSGHRAAGPLAYLGRYHRQLCALEDGVGGGGANFTSYGPGGVPGRRPPVFFSTARNGRATALLPLGGFERVMPLSMPVTVLLRALLAGNTELAAALGCDELAEEDLALCSFVCPGKQDYGAALRAVLADIEAGQ